jgi:hypothetical protein
MAKPIILIDLHYDTIKGQDISEIVRNATENEYHVIIRGMPEPTFGFQVFNDCKGLPDIDIELLIKNFMETQKDV